MRGKQFNNAATLNTSRITPACAGKTVSSETGSFFLRDHPRVCGENIALPLSDFQKAGSPPRVRGKLSGTLESIRPRRITPACAGKTERESPLSSYNQDHPRVCGENHKTLEQLRETIGSPPRVRGKLAPTVAGVKCDRITPACAGKTNQILPCHI